VSGSSEVRAVCVTVCVCRCSFGCLSGSSAVRAGPPPSAASARQISLRRNTAPRATPCADDRARYMRTHRGADPTPARPRQARIPHRNIPRRAYQRVEMDRQRNRSIHAQRPASRHGLDKHLPLRPPRRTRQPAHGREKRCAAGARRARQASAAVRARAAHRRTAQWRVRPSKAAVWRNRSRSTGLYGTPPIQAAADGG